MFGILKSLTKATLGVVFSPIAVAADIVTCWGLLNDRHEPYTVSSVRNIMRNMENAVDPDTLSDEQIRAIIRELERQNGK